jgi:hypothetical protein
VRFPIRFPIAETWEGFSSLQIANLLSLLWVSDQPGFSAPLSEAFRKTNARFEAYLF